jgi:hypothetical protein
LKSSTAVAALASSLPFIGSALLENAAAAFDTVNRSAANMVMEICSTAATQLALILPLTGPALLQHAAVAAAAAAASTVLLALPTWQ